MKNKDVIKGIECDLETADKILTCDVKTISDLNEKIAIVELYCHYFDNYCKCIESDLISEDIKNAFGIKIDMLYSKFCKLFSEFKIMLSKVEKINGIKFDVRKPQLDFQAQGKTQAQKEKRSSK